MTGSTCAGPAPEPRWRPAFAVHCAQCGQLTKPAAAVRTEGGWICCTPAGCSPDLAMV